MNLFFTNGINRNEVARHQQEKPLYLTIIDQKQAEVAAIYLSLYNYCIQHHQTPWSYYQRGLIHFQNGEIEQSLDDMRVLIETYENAHKADQLPPITYFDKGVAESELGLYHEAISSLSSAIQRDPANKEAYFERAVAYFEQGELDLALQDYLTSELKLPAQELDYFDYGHGFVAGIKKGIQEELGENFPLAVPVLNMGLWALANTPSPHAKLIQASIACVAAAGLYLTADQMATGLRDLVANWDRLSSHEQGELCGYLIGKYGIDVFAVASSAKMMEAYRNLKRSNQLLSFEYVLRSPSEVEVIKARYKGVEKYRQDKRYIQQVYGKKRYPEQEIRHNLKQMGYELPDRPKGIPENFETRYADKIGICYQDPVNPGHEYIRLMPGNPNSPNSLQKKPYVIHMRNGKALTLEGTLALSDDPIAHIPVEKYVYQQPIKK